MIDTNKILCLIYKNVIYNINNNITYTVLLE